MKKFKSLLCILMAMVLTFSCFVMTAFALNPDTSTPVTLHITKYQLKQTNSETDKIGTTNTLTGTTADAPTDGTVMAGAQFTIFKLGGMDANTISDAEIATIDGTYDSSANTITYKGSTITGVTKTTDANGQADFSIANADRGLYFVKETKACDNVTGVASSFVVRLPMTKSSGDGYLYDVYVYPKNYTTLGGGILQKVNDSDAPLSGAQFALYQSNGTQVTEDYYGNDIGDSATHYLTTDANGYIYVNNLTSGSYYFKETQAPDGYIRSEQTYSFTVEAGHSTEVIANADGTYTYTGITLLKAVNSSAPKIYKYVTEVNQLVDSISFGELVRWYVIADIPSDMSSTTYTQYEIVNTIGDALQVASDSVTVWLIEADNTTTQLTSAHYTVSQGSGNTLSISFTDFNVLSVGKQVKIMYKTTLDEAKTAMETDISSTATLDYGTSTSNNTANVSTAPRVYTSGYHFKTVSSEDASGLTGAKYNVYRVDYDILCGTYKVDENGMLDIKGLTDGDYYLVQTQAPTGYELITGKINFTVTKGSYSASVSNPLSIVNYPISKLPITGGSGTAAFTVVGLALIGLSAAFFAASKKAKKAAV